MTDLKPLKSIKNPNTYHRHLKPYQEPAQQRLQGEEILKSPCDRR